MLPLTHFLISIAIGFALEIQSRKKYTLILLLGIIGILPDIDHFLPMNGSTGVFHNVIILGKIPLAILIGVYMLENHFNPNSSKYQRFFTSVTVILYGHLILDLIAGRDLALNLSGTSLFYLNSTPILELGGIGVVFGTMDLAWLSLGLLVLAGNRVQKKLYELTEEYADHELKDIHKYMPYRRLFSKLNRS